MADSVDLPPNVILICPKCGTRNMRTDVQCGSCDADLTEAKRVIVAELSPSEKTRPEMPISFEQQVLTRLERIEKRAKENQGFMIIVLLLVILTIVF